MQQTLLLTLQGPQQRLDIELPGDVPVNDLLPLLQQVCDVAASDDRWAISRLKTGRSLQAAQTLLENEVLDGEVLVLHKAGEPIEPRPARRLAAPTKPTTQNGSIIITWEK